MSATRRQMLIQAQRNLDLADLLAERGHYAEAAKNLAAAKDLIFGTMQQASPAQPERGGSSE